MKADMLRKELNIFTFSDLLQHYPFRYEDRSRIYTISEARADFAYIQVKGTFTHLSQVGGGRGPKRLVGQFSDHSGTMEVVWFNGIKWVEKSIKPGQEYLLFGKPSQYKGVLSVMHPELEELTPGKHISNNAFEPVYPSTEKLRSKGLDSRGIAKLIKTLLADPRLKIDEIFNSEILTKYHLISREKAFRQVHLPRNEGDYMQALYRLKFEEIFLFQFKLLRLKEGRKIQYPGIPFTTVGDYFNEFYRDHIPFELTGAQKKVIKEIRADMGGGKQMNRLLMGDVGSGKTLVAFLCMLIAADNGYQCTLMAPTSILAQQHYNNLLQHAVKINLPIALLTGNSTQKERKQISEMLQNGTIKILIGTHALIEDAVQFQKLGLVIIDEQHRFGVEQRAKLWKKNESQVPHVLVMTATPIPRTLAMTVYGDLDTSIIDELPPGRKAINTVHRYEANVERVIAFIRDELKQGRQAYIVYPIIEENEKLDYVALEQGYEYISNCFPQPDYQISMVHGRMKSEEKDREMQRFKNRETQIMVATTVIEVGVDVPNASVMLIQNAERFGLTQLHQLRGRVGRGAEQSYCILMTSHKLSHDARIRLDTMVRTNNGFEIAETDLKLRGPGELDGTRQSGVLGLKLTEISKDQGIIVLSREAAERLVKDDINLQRPENIFLKQFILEKEKQNIWINVS